MKARIVIELELVADSRLRDALEIGEQAAAMLLVHRDVRLVGADAVGVEWLNERAKASV